MRRDPHRPDPVDTLRQDFRYATRTLRRTRRFTVPALATLALGAGFGLALLILVDGGLAHGPRLPLASDAPAWEAGWGADVRTLQAVQAESLEMLLRILRGATLLVVLIASINLGLLLAARAGARRHEVTLRAVLGAGRLRLTRQLLTEVGALAMLGGLIGFLVCGGVLAVLHATWPASLPRWPASLPSSTASVLALLLPLASAVGTGLIPLRAAMRQNLAASLGSGERTTPGPHEGIIRRWVVTLAVACSVGLLVSAGLLLRSFAAVGGTEARALGYDARDTLTLRIDRPPGGAAEAGVSAGLLAEVAAAPGVRSAGLASEGAWMGLGTEARVEVICGDGCGRGGLWLPVTRGVSRHHLASPGYFAALGIPVRRGREFSDGDGPGAERVAVISQTFAHRLFLGTDPLGKQVRVGGPAGEWHTVVGVVGEVRARGLGSGAEPVPSVYLPVLQQPASGPLYLAARAAGDAMGIAPAVEAAVRAAAPGASIAEVMTMEERLNGFVQPLRWFAGLIAALAGFGALVASLGLFGVVSYTVGRRTRELGVRMALGAHAGQVVRMVVWQSVRLTTSGVVLGLLGVLGVARLLQLLFLGVRPLDPLVYGVVVTILALVALAASVLPARRAARVDPLVALRSE